MGAMAMETSFVSDERFSQDEFRSWLERHQIDKQHCELIAGRIVVTPPASAWHGGVGSTLNWILREYVAPRACGRVFDATTGYELPTGDTLQPDVSFVSRARWDAGPRPGRKDFLRIVPSLVVEILSPSTAQRDRTVKLDIYARSGVEEYWIVDTRRRTVTLLCRSGEAFDVPVALETGLIPSRVLPDLNARVEDLFADLD